MHTQITLAKTDIHYDATPARSLAGSVDTDLEDLEPKQMIDFQEAVTGCRSMRRWMNLKWLCFPVCGQWQLRFLFVLRLRRSSRSFAL
jgi:hypothetical protein